ncbi:MAG: hypothetical protein HYR85_02240 [Planctomycetes bacterium]|nr:hypothetical protein [Planctomycetota bacterium]MBI3848411.1 hypothetical protein [Planctomycetota bacterium]
MRAPLFRAGVARLVTGVAIALCATTARAGTPPANDDCNTPFVIPTNGPFPFEGVITGVENATQSPTDMDCFDPGTPKAHSVWFEWTAPTGGRYGFDTCGSDYDAFVCVSNRRCPTGPITFDSGGCSIEPCICQTNSGSAASEISVGDTIVFMVASQSGAAPHTLHFRLGFEPGCQLGDLFRQGGFDPVLRVNGNQGHYGVVIVSPTDPFTMTIETPSEHHAPTARYVVHLWRGEPTPTDVFGVPHNLGRTCLPTYWSGLLPRPARTANTIGHPNVLGADNWPGPPTPPAPAVLLNFPSGLQRPGLRAYVQGIIETDQFGSPSFFVTNGLHLRVTP